MGRRRPYAGAGGSPKRARTRLRKRRRADYDVAQEEVVGKLRVPRPPRAPEVPLPDFEETDEIESSCNTEPHKKSARVRVSSSFDGRRRKPHAPRPGPVLNVRPAEECVRRPPKRALALPSHDPKPLSREDCVLTPPPLDGGDVRDSPTNAVTATPAAAAARDDMSTPAAPRTHERRRLSFSVLETPDGALPDSHAALQTPHNDGRAPSGDAFKSRASFSVPETPESTSEVVADDDNVGGALALHPALQVETAPAPASAPTDSESAAAGAAASRRRSRSVSVSGSEWSAASDRGGAVDAHPSLVVHTLNEDEAVGDGDGESNPLPVSLPLPATERFPESQLDEDDDAWADYAASVEAAAPMLTTASSTAPRGLLEQLEDAVAVPSSCERGASDKENASPCSKRADTTIRKGSADQPCNRRHSERACSVLDAGAGVTPLSAQVLVPPTPTPTPRRPRARTLVPPSLSPSPALTESVPETQTPHALRGSTASAAAAVANETPLAVETPHEREREILVPTTPSTVGTDARTTSTAVKSSIQRQCRRRRRSSFLVPPTPESTSPPARRRNSPRRRRRSVHWEDTPAQIGSEAPAPGEKDDAGGESAKDTGERVLFRPFRAGGSATLPSSAKPAAAAAASTANKQARMCDCETRTGGGGCDERSQPNYEAGMTPAKTSFFAGRSQPNYEAGMTPEGGGFNDGTPFVSSQPDYAAGQSPSPPRYVMPPAFPQSATAPLSDESAAPAAADEAAVRSKLFKAFEPAAAVSAAAASEVGRPEREPTPTHTPAHEGTPAVESPRCRGALRLMRYGRGRGADVGRTPLGDAACTKALAVMRARAQARALQAACPLEYTAEERRRSPADLTPRQLHLEAPASGGVTVGYRDDVLVGCVGSGSESETD